MAYYTNRTAQEIRAIYGYASDIIAGVSGWQLPTRITIGTSSGYHVVTQHKSGNIELDQGKLSYSKLNGWTPFNLVDCDTDTASFYTDTSPAGSWMEVDFTASAMADITQWKYYTTGPTACVWDIQYTDDRKSWSTAYTGLDMSGGAGWKTAMFDSVGAHRHWRSYKTNDASGGNYHTELSLTGSIVGSYNITDVIFPGYPSAVQLGNSAEAIGWYSNGISPTNAVITPFTIVDNNKGWNNMEWYSTLVSILAIIVLILSFAGGLKDGAVKSFFSLAILIISIPAAGASYRWLAGVLSFLPGDNWENFIGFFVTLAVISIILRLILFLPRKFIQVLWSKGCLSSLIGGVLKVIESAVGLVVFALVLYTYPFFSWLEEIVAGSGVLTWLVAHLGFVQLLMPQVFRG